MNQDELTTALQNALLHNIGDSQGFKTTLELQAETGWGKQKVLNHLRLLKAKGKLDVGYVHRLNLANISQPVWAYRLSNNEHEDRHTD